jgi:hypothetical protein
LGLLPLVQLRGEVHRGKWIARDTEGPAASGIGGGLSPRRREPVELRADGEKFFEIEGRFPRHPGELPSVAVDFVARQLGVPAAGFEVTGRALLACHGTKGNSARKVIM